MAFILASSFSMKELHKFRSIFTLAMTCLIEFGQHFIHELCSVGFWVWYPAIFGLLPRMRVFITWPLKFNTPKTQCLMTCRGNCWCTGFSLFASHSCAFCVKYSFLFLKKHFTSTLDIPERQILMNVTFWGRVILFHVQTWRGATLCYAVARTGPQEIMYRKIKMHQPTPPPPL